ncbi:MAG: hypothetical protein SVU32_03255 [Candidatus Nanohaloarchaea archaeon]|nr:hypothetical protein [Candidatus Nanohaloarchaea archaeon]
MIPMDFDLDSVKEKVGEGARQAREHADRVLEENEETINELKEVAQEAGEAGALGGKVAAGAVREAVVERYSDDPEQLRDDMESWASSKSDAVVGTLGWTDSEEFLQAHGYAEPSLDAFDHWGDEPWENDYSDIHTELEETVVEPGELPDYPVGEEGIDDPEYLARVASEAYAREHGLDDADFVLYHVEADEPATMLDADIHLKFYSENGHGVRER